MFLTFLLLFLYAEFIYETHLKSSGLRAMRQGRKQKSLGNFTGAQLYFPASQRMSSQCEDKTVSVYPSFLLLLLRCNTNSFLDINFLSSLCSVLWLITIYGTNPTGWIFCLTAVGLEMLDILTNWWYHCLGCLWVLLAMYFYSLIRNSFKTILADLWMPFCDYELT